MLAKRVPEGSRELDEEHRDHFQKLNDLANHLTEIRNKPGDFEKTQELGLEFYRALNRFVSAYLAHLDKEEEKIQPILRRLCTDQELVTAVNGFMSRLGSLPPEDAERTLKMMIPAYNIDELSEMFARAQTTSPEAEKNLRKLAEQTLSPDEWAKLKQRLPKP